MNTDFFNNEKIKSIYFMGIGGVSMSGLAELLHDNGYSVSGSDQQKSKFTNHLKDLGVKIFIGQKAENISDDIDIVVYTVAVKEDNPEFKAAVSKNIKIIDRAEFLGLVMKKYENPICVAGVHGKTSTTSMISQTLLEGDFSPTISVGGFFKPINGNFKIGEQKYFVVESCEYYDSFLKFYPKVGIILNIEEDHLDYFSGIDQINESFNKFAKNISRDGALIINNETENFNLITKDVSCEIITFGINDGDISAKNISYNEGCGNFDIYYKGEFAVHIELSVPGEHNIKNCLASFGACKVLKISADIFNKAMKNFSGSDRRFQHKGEINGVTVVDDYAHHPTEIKTTLQASKNMTFSNVWCVFQPHTYTRTKTLFDDFVTAFDDADKIIILDIYAAREIDNGEIHSEDLVKELKSRGLDAYYIKSFDECVDFLYENCIPNELLITMGAGDVYIVGEMLLDK